MNRLVVLVAVAVCLTTFVGVGAAQSNGDVTVTVHVVADDGSDVGGASVTVAWDGGESTEQTASNGRALIDVPSGADVSIAVDDEEYVRNNPVEIGTVTNHTTETVTVYPPTDGEIAVVADDDPVESATVTLTKRGDDRAAAEGTTDSDGIFAVDDLETGVYDVTVTKPGYYEESTTVDLAAVDDASVDIEPGTAEVSFAITDAVLEEPLAADVTVLNDGERDSTISTNQNGERRIDLSVNTEYTVVVEAEGYGTLERELSVGESDTSRSYGIERTPTLALETSNERVILGETVGVTVTDEYGDPVEGATVRVDGSTVATTDAAGSASVPVETAGELEFVAEADGTTSDSVVVEGIDPDADGEDGADEGSDENETERTDADDPAAGDGMPGFGPSTAAIAVAAFVGGLIALRRS
ncbi:carboxypeptidase-like regulatory domain-containing protein [Natrinema salaciae]|uniref:Carboxypeptidase regulatory-like domain-containing protein n=1 Tax=Natrinema salaciae TaxID=1186196 RepID=A0A1H8ZCA7_9EURY|nr:carboxypeptidase-like regulatory domain-containing protein [Natrinema salaciae]SEP61991.1 Carboxypeptidase regulatory-like domain-containing protein [Natrinema salaciae]